MFQFCVKYLGQSRHKITLELIKQISWALVKMIVKTYNKKASRLQQREGKPDWIKKKKIPKQNKTEAAANISYSGTKVWINW